MSGGDSMSAVPRAAAAAWTTWLKGEALNAVVKGLFVWS